MFKAIIAALILATASVALAPSFLFSISVRQRAALQTGDNPSTQANLEN